MSEKNKATNYKYCIVPMCESTSVKTPDKLFINLPSDKELRILWQKSMGRKDLVSNRGSKYCCEDHFNLEEDLENYLYLKLMKSGRIKLNPGVVPHKFKCQENRPYEDNEALPNKPTVSDASSQIASADTSLHSEIDIKLEDNSIFWESDPTSGATLSNTDNDEDNDDKSFQINTNLDITCTIKTEDIDEYSEYDATSSTTLVKTEDIDEYSEYDATSSATLVKTENDKFIEVNLIPISFITEIKAEDNLEFGEADSTSTAPILRETKDKSIQVNLVPKRRSKAIQCNLPLPKIKGRKRKNSNR